MPANWTTLGRNATKRQSCWLFRRLFQLVLTLVMALAAVLAAAAQSPNFEWSSTLDRDHPLVGMIWSTDLADFVTPDQVLDRAGKAHYVLIGEIHDNRDHHEIQAWLVGAIGARRKPAVVFEMISADQAEALRAHQDGSDPGPDELGPHIGWAESGWPDWSAYLPIAKAADKAGLRLHAGDASREQIRTVGREGLGSLSPERTAELALNEDLPDELNTGLSEEMAISHCNLLPGEALPAMVGVQRFRDATLARAMLDAADDDGAILIAGNGHVRADWGVPRALAQISGEDEQVLTIMLVEVTGAWQRPSDYELVGPTGEALADYVWFTPRTDREDPCDGLEEHFRKE